MLGLSSDTKPTTGVQPGYEFWGTDTDDLYIWTGATWALHQTNLRHVAGEEQAGQKYDSLLRATEDWKWQIVDHADDPVTVHNGPCRLGRIIVIEALAGDTCDIKDDTTTYRTLPAGAPAVNGAIEAFVGARFETSLIFDFGASASAGTFLVHYREAKFAD